MSDAKAPSISTARIVRCPSCGGKAVYASANPYRPFCGAACKGIDLGAWASEEYRMPEPPAASGGLGADSSDDQHVEP